MCLRSALTQPVCYPWPRLTLCKDSLTSFTCVALVRLFVGAPPRTTSKAYLGGRGRSKNGAMATSPIIQSRFTTHLKRIQVDDVSFAGVHRTNLAATKTRYSISKTDF